MPTSCKTKLGQTKMSAPFLVQLPLTPCLTNQRVYSTIIEDGNIANELFQQEETEK